MSTIVSAKFDKEDVKLIEKAVKLRGEDKSSFFRRAVMLELAKLGFMSDERKKVLGFVEDVKA